MVEDKGGWGAALSLVAALRAAASYLESSQSATVKGEVN